MGDFIEGILAKAVTEVGEGAVGRSLKEIAPTEKTQPGIVTKG
jgi:hypothetical protein